MPPQADLPPPPYTETDIYSTSSGDNPRSPLLSLASPNPIPHRHHRRESSASTIDNDTTIYTPPETPRTSSAEPLATVSPPPPATFVSAASYFDSRPAPRGLAALLSVGGLPHLTHTLGDAVGSGDDLPYPADTLAERDVTGEDWLTFGNYLRPRPPVADEKNKEAEPEREPSAAHINATLAEWNAGFFNPRGVVVLQQRHPVPDDQQPRVPGAWDAAFDGPASASAGPSSGGPPRFAGFNPFGAGGSGIRFGGIRIDGDRVSIGDRFVADRNGVRMGGLVADGNGISVNGQPMFGVGGGGPPPPMGGQRGPPGCGGRGGWGGFGGHHHRGGHGWGVRGGWGGPPGMGPCGGGGGGFGFGFGGRGGRGGWPGRGGGPPGEEGGRGRWRGRGRHGGGPPGARERSHSVSSAASSSSSSSSDSSVGSLPEYEDLRDAQLPVAKARLEEWLHHPDQPITRERIDEVREQIKAAKKAPSPPVGAGDPKAMKKEVKALLKEWKALKKQQSRARRELRRERRQKRKDERRERRNVRRDMRRAQRDFRRGHQGGPPPMPMPGVFPFVPPVPPHMGGGPPPAGGPFGHIFGRWPGAGLAGVPAPVHRHPGPVPPDVTSRTPGAWPDQFYGIDGDDAYRASREKYKVVRDLEDKIAGKESELIGVHEAITLEDEEKRQGGEKGKGKEKGQSKLETDAITLENEIEALTRSMNQLRTEADEEFAKELVADEERKQGGMGW
ncbi:hypothetical protein QBC39DRAFT_340193 [Podospora conica]|nr:hypothetical protein QBC39DRAFT_340193 [Schizothecium conicum]